MISSVGRVPVVLLPASGAANVYNHDRLRMQVLARALQQVEPRTQVVDGDQPDFLRRLIGFLAQGGHAVFAGSFGYDLTVEAEHLLPRSNMFDLFDTPVVGYLADHPFQPFMRQRMFRAAARLAFLVMDENFIAEAQAVNPALQRFRPVPTPCFLAELPAAAAERDLDIFVPMEVGKVRGDLDGLRDLVAAKAPQAVPLVGDLYDALRQRGSESIWSVFVRLCQDRFQAPPLPGRLPEPLRATAMTALGHLDLMLRREARVAVFHRLVAASRWAKVAVTMPSMGVNLPVWSKMQVISQRIAAEEMPSWYRRARFSVNVSPYDNEVNVRVTSAIAHGAVPVSDRRPGLAAFSHGHDILFLDRLGDGLEALREVGENELEAMRQAGRRHLPEYAPRRFAEILCDVLRQMG